MLKNSLYPPPIALLSDTIIGNVIQRSSPTYHYSTGSTSLITCPVQNPTQMYHNSSNVVFAADVTATSTGTSSNSEVGSSKRCKQRREVLEDRRTRIRTNQARYRKKLEDKPKELESNIQELKEQVEHLGREWKQILNGVSKQNNVWAVAVDYFRVFRNGFHSPEGAGILDIDTLRASIASDVVFNGCIGLNALVQSWRTFTQYFPDVQVQLTNLRQITEDLVHATTTTSFTLSDASFQNVFPSLTNPRGGGRCARIIKKLRGRKLALRGSVHFQWDTMAQRVVSLQTQADMMSPMMELLGSLEDVSFVFLNGFVALECNVVVNV